MRINKKAKKYLRNKTRGYLSKDPNPEELKQYLRLDLGENLIGKINMAQGISSLNIEILKYYADPSNTSIKETIASLYSISAENVTIANSSNELIDVLPKMILEKGEASIVVNPTFFRYQDSVLQAGGRTINLNLPKEGYKPSSKLIDDICKVSVENKVRIIWIANPNNPTGEIYQLEDIKKIVRESKSLVIIDEAYHELYDPQNKNSAVNLINEYRNVIVLRSLSKGYGLAGLRFGYAIAHLQTIEVIENYRETLLMTSAVIIKLAQEALLNKNYIQETADETRGLKKKIYSQIAKLENLQIGADTKTNIYLLRHKTKDLYSELLKQGIRTTNLNNTPGLESLNYIRITIGNESQNQKLLTALKEVN